MGEHRHLIAVEMMISRLEKGDPLEKAATYVYDIYLVNVLARARDVERGSIETPQNLQIMAGNGKAIPIAAVANFSYDLEQPLVWPEPAPHHHRAGQHPRPNATGHD